jgi:predicted permease
MDVLLQDLRYALRQLRKAPAFAVTAVVTLAIGIGATTAIFSTVNATLLRPLPYPHPEELLDVHTRLVNGQITSGLLSSVEIGALNRPNMPLVAAAGMAWPPFDATLIQPDGAPINVRITSVTEGFFRILGLPLTHGSGFVHDDFAAGPNLPVKAVISYRLWRDLFGGDPAIVGRIVRIAEAATGVTIVGVGPRDADLPHDVDFWASSRGRPDDVSHVFDTVLRLRSGAGIGQMRAAAAAAMPGLSATVPSDRGREYVIRPLLDSIVGDLRPTLLIILGATGLLLLLGCVNVTNLLLARGTARAREVAVRAALGAGHGRLVRQLLTESLVIAAAGAAAGLTLAYVAVRLLLALGASTLPRLQTVPFDTHVLLFAVTILLACGLATGLVPAWRLARTDIRSLMNETSRSVAGSRGASRLMSAMIAGEVALAIVLAAGAGWLVESYARLTSLDPGFVADGRLVVQVRPTRRFTTPEEGHAYADAILRQVRTASGAVPVGSSMGFPLTANFDGGTTIETEEQAPDPDHPRGAHFRLASPGFFKAAGIRILAGRAFTDDDRRETQAVAVVNRAFVRLFFGGDNAVGRRFRYGYPQPDPKNLVPIVGVVDDVRYESLDKPAEPAFYLAEAQLPFPPIRQSIVIATSGPPAATVTAVRAGLKRFDPQLMVDVTTATAIVSATLGRQRLGMALMLIFGVTALTLAAVGIYGVIAYTAAQREGELATRLALGASPGDIFRLMMSAGRRLAIVGAALGLFGAYAAGRIVASRVYEMRANDPIVLVSAAAVVAVITFLATAVPAVRASRLNPTRALRSE